MLPLLYLGALLLHPTPYHRYFCSRTKLCELCVETWYQAGRGLNCKYGCALDIYLGARLHVRRGDEIFTSPPHIGNVL
jgi:hypothetical protein